MSEPHAKNLGRLGEQLAEEYLCKAGFTVLCKNYRAHMSDLDEPSKPGKPGRLIGEIDLVARRGSMLVFVEVKTRSSQRFGAPAEAVTRVKQQKLRAAAQTYLIEQPGKYQSMRFDVVEVLIMNGQAYIHHIPEAF